MMMPDEFLFGFMNRKKPFISSFTAIQLVKISGFKKNY